MKIALLSRAAFPLHEPGGMERAVYQLATHLRAAGAETLLFTRPATRRGEFPGEVVSVAYGGLPLGRHGRVLDRSLNYPTFVSRLGRAVAAAVREGRVDVVLAQGITALGYGRLRRGDPTLRAPLVMNPQGMEEHKARGWKRLALTRLRALSREAARLSDRVVATDEATRAEVPLHLGVSAERVIVLPNAVDLEELDAATPPDAAERVAVAFSPLAAASPILLSVGRLEGYKGFEDVLRALALLHAERALGDTWAWVVVGDGPRRKALAERVARARLQRHVVLAGRVDETLLHSLYETADLFVHATRFEGSSLVTLEAMAHRLPVVATRAGGIPDKVVEGETGRLVEPGDVEALAAALAAVVGDPAAARRMGEAGRARATLQFAWPGVARRTKDALEALCREAAAGSPR